jgi:ribosomal protein S18 acetylase RimI-like enzyme
VSSEDPLAHWPARTPLYDEDGRLLLVGTPTEDAHSGRTWIDGVWRPDDVPVSATVECITEAFPGCAMSTSDASLVAGLLGAGAEQLRHAHSLSHDLSELPRDPARDDMRVETVDAAGLHGLADQVGPVLLAAYPRGHPDHRHDTIDEAATAVHRVADGEVLGPLLDATTVAWNGVTLVGACLVVDREGTPPDGGPWVLDIFRDPAAQVAGVGSTLLIEALRAVSAAGLPGLSLVVSHANVRAHRLYRRLGFADISESWTLAIRGS